jgi:predicted RNA-binding Zn ribbon-like protein
MDASRVFNLSADHVALDFINTLDDRFVPDGQVEKLESYADLLRFAEQTRTLTAAQAATLSRLAKHGNAAGALRAAVELREILAQVFYATAQGQRVAARDLAALNESVAEAARHRVLHEQAGRFAWRWEGVDKNLDGPLWAVVQEAADVLASPDLKFVRTCGRDSCRWLFLDTSKNHSRRWCDMKVCGNRVKARRYYALHGRE